MFECESCGHPLSVHDPCSAQIGKGRKARICGCPRFAPEELKARVATLTDIGERTPPPITRALDDLRRRQP